MATLGKDKAPVSKAFGKVLVSIPRWKERWPFLHKALEYLGKQSNLKVDDWSLDAAWDGIDENYKLRRILRDPYPPWPSLVPKNRGLYLQHPHPLWDSFWVLAGWELRRAVADVYGTRVQRFLTKRLLEGKEITKRFRKLDPDGDTIVTTNYDLLVEGMARVHWTEARNYLRKADFMARKSLDLKTIGPIIIKLHGSLDWVFGTSWLSGPSKTRNYVERAKGSRPMTDKDIDLHKDGWELRPLLLAPVKYKDEMLMPGNQPDEVVEVLTAQWARFRDALDCADEMHVFGYGFPRDDAYGVRILQEAARKRAPNHMLQVFLNLPDHEAGNVAARLKGQIFFRPKSVRFHCCGSIPS